MARKCMCGVYITGTTSTLCPDCEEGAREAEARHAKAARAEEQHKAKDAEVDRLWEATAPPPQRKEAEVVNLATRRGGEAEEVARWLRDLASDMEAGKVTALMVVGVMLDGEARPGDVSLARLRYVATTEDKVKLAGLLAAASFTLNLSLSQNLNLVEV